ncbi:MAG: exopolysaccharide biosynthesis polyprenyl glycosylphosphotransferase [Snowella sp.]|nr:exopolysaccharide biosynthesis polyprenyl glycosylphosphotransferase [Snowella sp.]
MPSGMPESEFPISTLNDCSTITIPERLSVLEAVKFKAVACTLIEQENNLEQLILDFSQTQFIDSSGIGSLVHLFKATQEKEVQLVLLEVNSVIMSVLSMTGLDQIFLITSKEDSLNTSPNGSSRLSSVEVPPKTHPSIRSWLKRSVDIVGASIGLVITGIVLIPIAIAIQIDDPGPIFFRQTRCGWMGRRFKMLKFRSMCTNAEALKDQVKNEASGAFFKNSNDPRITKVGRFLRRTSLDELPQFWNVLKGEMSLVGTRPPTPDEVENYEVPEWQRLDVKPGMTGEWQVNGRSTVKSFEDVIKLDLRYQENWSHWYDIQLILKTVFIIFNKNSGAL